MGTGHGFKFTYHDWCVNGISQCLAKREVKEHGETAQRLKLLLGKRKNRS